MKILKFGGTSLGSLDIIKVSASIVVEAKKKNNVLVVVSAMTGVTDELVKICDLATAGDLEKVLKSLGKLKKKHIDVAETLCNGACDLKFIKKINHHIVSLEEILRGISHLRQMSHRSRAKVLYYGEILCSHIFSLAINQAGIKSNPYLSREILFCYGDYMDGACNYEKSQKNINKFKKKIDFNNEIPVVTGFGGGDDLSNIYLFDRGGSDYVATIFGKLLGVKALEIWTDVDGIMSADPSIVKKPILWKELDYMVAAEFALTGAKILHPKTISPIKKHNIPIYLRNTFNINAPGTKIHNLKSTGIKGVSIDDNQTLFTFIDPSMIGASGYMGDIISMFSDKGISVDSIATTETSFSVSIKKKYYYSGLEKEFDSMKEHFNLELKKRVSKISIVGDNIDNYKILTKLKGVVMFTFGSYNKSLTIFVKTSNSKKLLKELHKQIFGK